MPRNFPKCASRQSPVAPSPCSTMTSIAVWAEARSVTATRPSQRMTSGPVCAEDAGGEVLGGGGEVRPAEMRCRADRSEQVLAEGEVQHLLFRDGEDDGPPAVDRLELRRREALVRPLLHRERREEVLAEDRVLELRRLAEQIHELLAVLDDDRRLGRGRKVADPAAHGVGLRRRLPKA